MSLAFPPQFGSRVNIEGESDRESRCNGLSNVRCPHQGMHRVPVTATVAIAGSTIRAGLAGSR